MILMSKKNTMSFDSKKTFVPIYEKPTKRDEKKCIAYVKDIFKKCRLSPNSCYSNSRNITIYYYVRNELRQLESKTVPYGTDVASIKYYPMLKYFDSAIGHCALWYAKEDGKDVDAIINATRATSKAGSFKTNYSDTYDLVYFDYFTSGDLIDLEAFNDHIENCIAEWMCNRLSDSLRESILKAIISFI